jgi:hypothetical protein
MYCILKNSTILGTLASTVRSVRFGEPSNILKRLFLLTYHPSQTHIIIYLLVQIHFIYL